MNNSEMAKLLLNETAMAVTNLGYSVCFVAVSDSDGMGLMANSHRHDSRLLGRLESFCSRMKEEGITSEMPKASRVFGVENPTPEMIRRGFNNVTDMEGKR